MSTKPRAICYHCHRPQTSCMCRYITPLETNTRFIILMHPKEFRKTKNGTGHFTHLSLKNSRLYVGIDFTAHQEINAMIEDENNTCYVLYPSTESISLNEVPIGKSNKQTVLFLIDSTWPCSRAMLKASPNIDALQKVSFTHTKSSAFVFKEQPNEYCLSTMESTYCVLQLLNEHHYEDIDTGKLERFLRPFEKMVAYQLSCNIS
ncbi:MAG TPA: DTW domain-containing protein [Sulfurovum sp.]|nr:DTW domain-containing protein [Sulfurovum sp.]